MLPKRAQDDSVRDEQRQYREGRYELCELRIHSYQPGELADLEPVGTEYEHDRQSRENGQYHDCD
jgi:hypothetical protein